MKITDVECLVLDNSFPFVRVHTDEGLTGIGECFRRQPKVTKTLIDDLLKPALVGKDPTSAGLSGLSMTSSRNYFLSMPGRLATCRMTSQDGD